MTQETQQPCEPEADDTFGLCPLCHKVTGYVNAGKSHRFYCQEHKVSWLVGSNLFSSWREQTEEEQRKIWADLGMDDYEDIEPFFFPRPIATDIDLPEGSPLSDPLPF